MNRITRLALVAVVPVGAALAVAIPPALAGATGSGKPSVAIAADMSSQLRAEDENDKKTTPPPKKTTPPPKTTPAKTTPPPKTTPPATPTRTALPVTGSDSNPNVLWLVASGLLTAGGGLLLLARRLRNKADA